MIQEEERVYDCIIQVCLSKEISIPTTIFVFCSSKFLKDVLHVFLIVLSLPFSSLPLRRRRRCRHHHSQYLRFPHSIKVFGLHCSHLSASTKLILHFVLANKFELLSYSQKL